MLGCLSLWVAAHSQSICNLFHSFRWVHVNVFRLRFSAGRRNVDMAVSQKLIGTSSWPFTATKTSTAAYHKTQIDERQHVNPLPSLRLYLREPREI